MKEIRLKLKVVTPMFLGGADGKKAELRPPSVKGLLRFWWRATQASLNLKQLQEKEGEIFGAAGEKESKKSSFSIVIKVSEVGKYCSSGSLPRHEFKVKGHPLNILDYLAYGTQTWDKQVKKNIFVREYIKPDSDFTFELILKIWEEKNWEDILKALQVFYLFGGLGAKTRNGFGALEIIEAEGTQEVKAISSLAPDNAFKEQCSFNNTPSFPAFSTNARLFKTKKQHQNWHDSLAELGFAYREARLSLERSHHYEKRQYLGAPIIVNKKPKSHLDRHAKPYFLRVYRQNGGYTGYILYLPASYLPPEYCSGLGIAPDKYKKLNLNIEEKAFANTCKQLNDEWAKNPKLEEVKLH